MDKSVAKVVEGIEAGGSPPPREDSNKHAIAQNKLTPDMIEAKIDQCEYHRSGELTVCILTLENGFRVIGHSAPIDPSNFNEPMGKEVARKKAVDQIWMLEGYLAKEAMHQERLAAG